MQIKVPQRVSETHTIFQSSVYHIWGFWVNQKSYKSTCSQTACYWLCFWGGLCTLFIQAAVRNRVLLCNMPHIWQIHIKVCSGYVSAFGQITPCFYYIHAKMHWTCCSDITSSFGRGPQPKHCNNIVVTARFIHKCILWVLFWCCDVWAFHKISLLYCFNFVHCFIATGAL